MKQPRPQQNPFSPLMALVGPIAVFVLYVMVLGHDLDAPDLDFVSIDPSASATFPADQVWFASTPPERPDLSAYSPVYGMLLKAHYLFWPGRINLYRTTGMFIFMAAALFFSLLVMRLLKDDLARLSAMLLFALHPMMTEANALISAQSVLLALAAWMASLWVYHIHLGGRLSLPAAAVVVAACYFLAFGSHEAALLMPLSLAALHLFPQRIGNDAEEAPGARPAPLQRALWIGIPVASITLILFVMRWVALDGALAPHPTVRPLADYSFAGRLFAAPSAVALGLLKLFFPVTQSFFYNPNYDPAALLPIWLSIPVLAGFALMLISALIQGRVAAMGLALAFIPLIALIQWVPLAVFFNERHLAFCVPGIALALGDIVGTFAPLDAPGLPPRRARNIRIAVAVVLLLCAGLTLRRNHVWGRPAGHWAAESRARPGSPEPHIMQLISMISRPGENLDTAAIRQSSESAIRLAKGADADPAYQYLALFYLQMGNAPAMRTLLETVLKDNRARRYGFFNGLGVVGAGLGLFELAEQALLRENELWPGDFNNLFALADLYSGRSDWAGAYPYARAASDKAPSHMSASAALRLGQTAVNIPGKETEGLAALARAIDINPTLPDPYLLTADHFMRAGEYFKVETILQTALRSARMPSLAPLCALQAESYEREKKPDLAVQFLIGMTTPRTLDFPLQFFTARFLLDRKLYDDAQRFYGGILREHPNDPNAIYGMARIYAERDGRFDVAANALRAVLKANPSDKDAAALLAQVEARLAGADAAAQSATPPDQSASGSKPALAPIPIK